MRGYVYLTAYDYVRVLQRLSITVDVHTPDHVFTVEIDGDRFENSSLIHIERRPPSMDIVDPVTGEIVSTTIHLYRVDALEREGAVALDVTLAHSLSDLARRYLLDDVDMRLTFDRLADRWEQETLLIASPREAVLHEAYQAIVGLGPQAVPLLLKRLERTRRNYFWALGAITRAAPAAGLDRVDEAITAWMEWGHENGYAHRR